MYGSLRASLSGRVKKFGRLKLVDPLRPNQESIMADTCVLRQISVKDKRKFGTDSRTRKRPYYQLHSAKSNRMIHEN